MSPPSPRTLTATPADLCSRLQADLTRQRAAGNLWLVIAVCLAVAITAYFGWLGLHRAHAAPTWVPMILAAMAGLAGIVAAALVRQRRLVWLREALASSEVAVMEGALQSAEILPQQARFARAPRSYVLGDYRHVVLEESPSTDALSGFVPQHVVGPVPGTPLRLVWSAAHPGHLLQVDYPGMGAVADTPAPMESQDWRDLSARPRAALRAAAWLGAAMVAGLAAMALLLPTVSRGFSVWLWVGLLVLTVWLLGTWVPALRMWLQRDTDAPPHNCRAGAGGDAGASQRRPPGRGARTVRAGGRGVASAADRRQCQRAAGNRGAGYAAQRRLRGAWRAPGATAAFRLRRLTDPSPVVRGSVVGRRARHCHLRT